MYKAYNIPRRSQEKDKEILEEKQILQDLTQETLKSYILENLSYITDKNGKIRCRKILRKSTREIGNAILNAKNLSAEAILKEINSWTYEQRKAFLYLISMRNKYRFVFPSQTTIGIQAGLQRQAINKFVAYLYEIGWLIKIKRLWKSCLYEFNVRFFDKELRKFLSEYFYQFKMDIDLELKLTFQNFSTMFRYSWGIKAFLRDLLDERTLSLLGSYYYNNFIYNIYVIYKKIIQITSSLQTEEEILQFRKFLIENEQENYPKGDNLKSNSTRIAHLKNLDLTSQDSNLDNIVSPRKEEITN